MKFINYDTCGLAVWGMKGGLQLFDFYNLNEDKDFIEDFLPDLRTTIKFLVIENAKANIVYYGIEHQEGFTCLTIYRTINDWAERWGYYAISLFIPANRMLPKDKTANLLKQMSDDYWQLYIEQTAQLRQIKKDLKDDIGPLIATIKNTEFRLTSTDGINQFVNKEKGFIRFKDNEQLSLIFDYYDREGLIPYRQLFCLPVDQSNLVCNLKQLILPPIAQKFNISFRIIDAIDGKTAIRGAKMTIYKDGIPIVIKEQLENDDYTLKDLTIKNKINVTVEKIGFLSKVISPDEITKYLEGRSASESHIYWVSLKFDEPVADPVVRQVTFDNIDNNIPTQKTINEQLGEQLKRVTDAQMPPIPTTENADSDKPPKGPSIKKRKLLTKINIIYAVLGLFFVCTAGLLLHKIFPDLWSGFSPKQITVIDTPKIDTSSKTSGEADSLTKRAEAKKADSLKKIEDVKNLAKLKKAAEVKKADSLKKIMDAKRAVKERTAGNIPNDVKSFLKKDNDFNAAKAENLSKKLEDSKYDATADIEILRDKLKEYAELCKVYDGVRNVNSIDQVKSDREKIKKIGKLSNKSREPEILTPSQKKIWAKKYDALVEHP